MQHPVDTHVGQRIRQRRWVLGTTQQQLAEQVGIKFQQIQKYETGANRVSASRLWDISQALQVSVAFFFDGLQNGAPQTADALSSRETMELVRVYARIPPEHRRKLFDLAKALSTN